MKIFIYCPVSIGGIAEHIHYQAKGMLKRGACPVVLAASDYLSGRRTEYEVCRIFQPEKISSKKTNIFSRSVKILFHSSKIIADQCLLVFKIFKEKPDCVLIGWYGEYLSPLWVWPHWLLARFRKVCYIVNLHDPVRDFVVGPKWWHELSVRMAYWPISVGVVHQKLPEPSPVPEYVVVVEAPVGVYDLQEVAVDPESIRAGWMGRVAPEDRRSDPPSMLYGGTGGGVEKAETLKPETLKNKLPEASELARDSENTSLNRSVIGPATNNPLPVTPASPDVVFLAFGFIRDNKNLDLVIRGLVENPQAFLVVMGRAQSQKDKPVEFYQNLAEELGVGDRVRFFNEFVPDEKLAGYFAAADVVVLTYDKTFHSQSGVLNVAARARRPVLASSGESPLKECVEKFNLGVFVKPDDLEALKEGMKLVASDEWRVVSGKSDWEGYEAFASWDVNVGKILEAVVKVKIIN